MSFGYRTYKLVLICWSYGTSTTGSTVLQLPVVLSTTVVEYTGDYWLSTQFFCIFFIMFNLG